jgi:hypothetical protein
LKPLPQHRPKPPLLIGMENVYLTHHGHLVESVGQAGAKKTVPLKPTAEMLEEAVKALRPLCMPQEPWSVLSRLAETAWEAMISASPYSD